MTFWSAIRDGAFGKARPLRVGHDFDYQDQHGRPQPRTAHVCLMIDTATGKIENIGVYSSGPDGLTTLRGYVYAQLFETTHPLRYGDAARDAERAYRQSYPQLAARYPIRSPR